MCVRGLISYLHMKKLVSLLHMKGLSSDVQVDVEVLVCGWVNECMWGGAGLKRPGSSPTSSNSDSTPNPTKRNVNFIHNPSLRMASPGSTTERQPGSTMDV